MKILITGSAGFIGYNLAKNLLEKKGFKIIGIDNFNDYKDQLIKENQILSKNQIIGIIPPIGGG